jgi:Tfp pilus assembly protein FimT
MVQPEFAHPFSCFWLLYSINLNMLSLLVAQRIMTKDGVHSTGRQPGGFTVPEALIVLGILFALAAIVVPNLSGWASNQRLKSAARGMVTHLQYARLEAIKRSTHIAFTFNTDEDVGPDGYRVFLDQGSGGTPPGNRVQDSTKDEITLLDMAMPDDVTLEGTTFTDNEWGMNAFAYNARGFPVDSSFSEDTGVVTLTNATLCYQVILDKTSGGLKLADPKPRDECEKK